MATTMVMDDADDGGAGTNNQNIQKLPQLAIPKTAQKRGNQSPSGHGQHLFIIAIHHIPIDLPRHHRHLP